MSNPHPQAMRSKSKPADCYRGRASSPVAHRVIRSAEGEMPSGQPAGRRRYKAVRTLQSVKLYFNKLCTWQ